MAKVLRSLLLLCFVTAALSAALDGGFVPLEEITEEEALQIVNRDLVGRSSRIVNGNTAVINQFPYYVYIVIKVATSNAGCGGSLLNDRWVLSAGHCFINAKSSTAFFGSVDKSVALMSRSSSGFYNAPGFTDEKWWEHDMALLQLSSAVTFSNAVGTIQLPPRSYEGRSFSGQSLTAIGYGKNLEGSQKYLQYIDMNGVSDAQCLASHWVFTNYIFCAIGSGGYGGICSGDSGGPVVLKINGVPTVIGAVSFYTTCDVDPQGFSRVDRYLNWISSKTGIAIRSA